MKNVEPAYAAKVAMAAPIIPIFGINKIFSTMFTIAPKPVRQKVSLLKFSVIKYWVLAAPKKTNMPDHI